MYVQSEEDLEYKKNIDDMVGGLFLEDYDLRINIIYSNFIRNGLIFKLKIPYSTLSFPPQKYEKMAQK